MRLAGFDGSSNAILRFQEVLAASLARNGPHLLVGEAGSGKTHAAYCLSAIHKAKPIIVTGRESLANGLAQSPEGCVLIEEIGSQPPCVQKGLQYWIGRGVPGPIVICTSSWTVKWLKQDGRLGAELAALLEPCTMMVPTLHDRLPDLGELFVRWSAEDGVRYTLDRQSIVWLGRQEWPGNLRQLRQILHHVACQSPGSHVMPVHLAELHRSSVPVNVASFEDIMARYLPSLFNLDADTQGKLHACVLSEVERPLFRLVLEATDGNQIRAAALLGINRNTLRKKLGFLGIDAGSFRS